MKKIILSLIIIILVTIGYFWLGSDSSTDRANPSSTSITPSQEDDGNLVEFDKSQFSLEEESSLWLIVNKQRPISADYVPADLRQVDVPLFPGKDLNQLQLRDDAATALENMVAAALEYDVELMLGSGYRSYSVQQFYYDNYVANYGQSEADKFSAMPGTSEHQTGLAMDMTAIDRECYLQVCFEDLEEGQWLKKNAHVYGFIIRYPAEKEDITGYQYEPWHLRYVGAELSNELNDQDQITTLEEFFEI